MASVETERPHKVIEENSGITRPGEIYCLRGGRIGRCIYFVELVRIATRSRAIPCRCIAILTLASQRPGIRS